MLLLAGLIILNLGTFGHVYEVVEPDLLVEIERQARTPDVGHELTQKVRQSFVAGLYLPDVKERSVREFGVSYGVNEGLVIDGSVLARKGDEIDVLERINIRTRYLFLKDYQMPLFRELLGQHGNVAAVITEGDVLPLIERNPGARVYMANRQLIEKLRVAAVPSLVYQRGNKLVVEEIPYITGQ